MVRMPDCRDFDSCPGTKIFVAPGEHSFFLFQVENIPWNICVLLTSPILNIKCFFAYVSLWNSRISVSLKRHFQIPACSNCQIPCPGHNCNPESDPPVPSKS